MPDKLRGYRVEQIRKHVLEQLDMTREHAEEEILAVIDEEICRSAKERVIPLNWRKELRMQVFHSLRKLDVLQELLNEDDVTEIMVNDSMQKDRHRYDRRVRYRFLEEWIARAGMVWDRNFVERGLRLGIDIERPRRVLAIHFERYQELSDTQEGQQHLETMEASVRHFTDQEKNILYLREPTKQLCFINACPDQKMQEIGEQLIELIRGKYGERIVIGIDSERSWKDGGHIGRLCEEAEKAAEYCEENGRDIMFYKELSVELFLDEISAGTMKKYLDKLFPVEEEELGYFMTIVSVYFQVDGSITRMAEVLFMHKNTIQYKLKKLEALSGKDIRTPQGASVYYMALAFYKKLYGESRLVRCV